MSRARKQDRFSSTLAVSYREPTSSEPSLGTCADISPSGMFIETARPAARGVLVRFECVSQATQGVVRGTARVMWLRPHNEAQGKSGMGVRFVRLEPGSARVIEELIAHANNAGTRTKSDGPEARATSEEPSVVLTAERTIGPTNRSSSIPPKGLRAPTLRGMYPSDVRSPSSAPPPPKERKAFDSGPPREPGTRSSAPPRAPEASQPNTVTTTSTVIAANPEADRRSSRPPGEKISAHSQALRERTDRGRRPDETPAESHRAAADPEPEIDARITAPDGSLIDPTRDKPPAPAPRSLGATMHDAVQPSKLSAKTGARRGSDNTLGVPSPPPPPWKARHSERPPEPGGVEVIRAVPVATEGQAQPMPPTEPAAQHPVEADSSAAASTRYSTPAFEAQPVPPSELPGATDPPLSDWEPGSETSRPAMRPDRSPDISVPYVLPESTDQSSVNPGRDWVPYIVVGSGLLVTIIITLVIGRPSFSMPKITGDDSQTDDALAPEDTFVTQKEPAPTAEVAPKQALVKSHVEPLGAKVSALGQTITSPGTLAVPYESVQWPLRVRIEMAGYGAAELMLPRQAFAADGDTVVHELYLELQPVPAGAPQPAVQIFQPAPAPVPSRPGTRKPVAAKPKQPAVAATPAQPEPGQPSMLVAPPPGTAEAPAPEAPAAEETPLQRALACLSRGDNACVLETLGNASGAREIELLIETYRATGDGSSAEAAMRRYLQLYPEGKRASQYRRALGILTPLPAPQPE